MGKSNSKKIQSIDKKSYEKFSLSLSVLLNNIFTNGNPKYIYIKELKYLKKEGDIEYMFLFQKIIIDIINEEDKLKEIHKVVKYIEFDIFSNDEEKSFFLFFLYKFYKLIIDLYGENYSINKKIKSFLKKLFEEVNEKKIKLNLIDDINLYQITSSSNNCTFDKLFNFWEEKNNIKTINKVNGNLFSNLKEILKKVTYLIFIPQLMQIKLSSEIEYEDHKEHLKLFYLIGKTEKLSWISNDSTLNYIIYKFIESDKSSYRYSINFFIFREKINKLTPGTLYYVLLNLINFLIVYNCSKKNQEKYLLVNIHEIKIDKLFLNSNENDSFFFANETKYNEDLLNFHKEFLYYFNYITEFSFLIKYKFLMDDIINLSFLRSFEKAPSFDITFNDLENKKENFKLLFSKNNINPVSSHSNNIFLWKERKLTYSSNVGLNFTTILRKLAYQFFIKIEIVFSSNLFLNDKEKISYINHVISQINYENATGLFLKVFCNVKIDKEALSEWFEKFYEEESIIDFKEYAFIFNNRIINFNDKTFLKINNSFKMFKIEIIDKVKKKYFLKNSNNVIFEENSYYVKEYLKNCKNSLIFLSMNKKYFYNLNIYAKIIDKFYEVINPFYSLLMKYYNEILLLQGINFYIDSKQFFDLPEFASYFFFSEENFNYLINQTSIHLVDSDKNDLFISYDYEHKICKIFFEDFQACIDKIKFFLNGFLKFFLKLTNVDNTNAIYKKFFFSDLINIIKQEKDLFDYYNNYKEEKQELLYEFSKTNNNVCFKFSSFKDLIINKPYQIIHHQIFYFFFDIFLKNFNVEIKIDDLFSLSLINFERYSNNLNNFSKKSLLSHCFHNINNVIIYQIIIFGNKVIFNVEFDPEIIGDKTIINSMIIFSGSFFLVREFLSLINCNIKSLELNLEEDLSVGKEKINNIQYFGQVFHNFEYVYDYIKLKIERTSLNIDLISEKNDFSQTFDNKFNIIREKLNVRYVFFYKLSNSIDLIINIKSPDYYDYYISKIKEMFYKIPKIIYFNNNFHEILNLLLMIKKINNKKIMNGNIVRFLNKFIKTKKSVNISFS